MKPREFFPNMPDEVFNAWLSPFIEQIGWPFTAKNTDTSGTRWRYLLGPTTLKEWQDAKWEVLEIDVSSPNLTQNSRNMVGSILGNCLMGAQTITANLENTKERFRACAEFVSSCGSIPGNIIAIINEGKVEIVDGHHRVAALLHIKNSSPCTCKAWVPTF